jgi:Xaa-Pro aminopeptidase
LRANAASSMQRGSSTVTRRSRARRKSVSSAARPACRTRYSRAWSRLFGRDCGTSILRRLLNARARSSAASRASFSVPPPASGPSRRSCRAICSSATLNRGDHLSLLIEINGPGGFYTEIARTIVLGHASNQLLDGFENVREAQVHTLGQIKPGVSCRDVAQAHDDYMRARGLPPETRLYAHGQGYDMVERPLIRADESMCFEEGMCLAVHPGYETPEIFAVICDNYMVGAQGPGECLHETEKKVFEIPV